MTKSTTLLSVTALQQHTEQCLSKLLNQQPSNTLEQAIHYTLLNPGKRIRPSLVYAVGLDLAADIQQLDAAAIAVELMHTYSLIHDDLPAMDDDDLRRGKPSCHKAFNEATAILTGDAIQCLAFEILAQQSTDQHNPKLILQMIDILAKKTGALGMIKGQQLDLNAHHLTTHTLEHINEIHSLKTGALLQACLSLGALAAGTNEPTLISSLNTIGYNLGMAFQIQDDLLDVTSNTATLGKKTGADAQHHKLTYPALTDITYCKEKAQWYIDNSYKEINKLPSDMPHLEMMIDSLTHRTK